MKFLRFVISLILSTVLSTTVFAAGGSKNPFVAIDDRIVEVEGAISSIQEQIDLLVARVDTMEERVTANEDAITTLQNQNAALEALVQQNLADIASIENQIAQLEQANADLQAQITSNSSDIQVLQGQVTDNEALIATLQSALLMVQEGQIALESSLQAQIDNNGQLISGLQSEIESINDILTLKQNLVNGTCPNGSAIREILPDGSVICGNGSGGTSGQLESVLAFLEVSLAPGETQPTRAYCPDGYTAVDVGFYGDTYTFTILRMHTTLIEDQFGYIRPRNTASYRNTFYNVTTCLRIAT